MLRGNGSGLQRDDSLGKKIQKGKGQKVKGSTQKQAKFLEDTRRMKGLAAKRKQMLRK